LDAEDLVSETVRLPLGMALPGEFNRANAAMALVALISEGVDAQTALTAMRQLSTVAGRFATHTYRGRRLRLLLAKNPAGWLETIELVRRENTPLVIAFNANGVDGRDPSWLYDVPFHGLAGRKIVVIGQRSVDIEVRLKLDGVEYLKDELGLLHALAMLPEGEVDLLANYTAFQDARRELVHAERQ
jgi:UDP-N-acetylmuramyl tripeptide synthase